MSPNIVLISVDNSATGPYDRKVSANEYELSGENSSAEFSGWQRGVNFARSLGVACDLYLFGNDRLLHRSSRERPLLNPHAARIGADREAIIGAPLSLPVAGSVLGYPVIPYIRTHLFLAARTVVDALRSVVSISPQIHEQIFHPQYIANTGLFKPEAPLSLELQQFLFRHVTEEWYRRKAYSPEHWQLINRKMASILNAFLLSIRVRDLGYSLIALSDLCKESAEPNLDALWMKNARHVFTKPVSDADKFWMGTRAHYQHIPEKRTVGVFDRLSLFRRRAQLDHL